MVSADSPDTSLVEAGTLPWAELFPGFEIQLLRVGGETGRYTVTTRIAPGTEIPTHHHHGEVHAWTISGQWRYREYPWTARAGDYVYEESGSTHTLYVPESATESAVVVFVIEGAQDYLDSEGVVFFTQTAPTVLALYRDALAARGLDLPTAVLP